MLRLYRKGTSVLAIHLRAAKRRGIARLAHAILVKACPGRTASSNPLSAILILFVGASCATTGARLVPSSPLPNRIQTAARLVYVRAEARPAWGVRSGLRFYTGQSQCSGWLVFQSPGPRLTDVPFYFRPRISLLLPLLNPTGAGRGNSLTGCRQKPLAAPASIVHMILRGL